MIKSTTGTEQLCVRVDRIVCLANSYKHENRCVAGISLSEKKWLRLVSDEVSGCLTQQQTCYETGVETSILDIFEAELGDNCGSEAHPEDVLVTGRSWRRVGRFDMPKDRRYLAGCTNKRDRLFAGYGDRLYVRRVMGGRIGSSLELVQPEDLWWWIREENGKRKNRALFRAGHSTRCLYELAVTDPVWLAKMRPLPIGIYRHQDFFDGQAPVTFLTISLSELFEGFHYKLVAGVVTFPSDH